MIHAISVQNSQIVTYPNVEQLEEGSNYAKTEFLNSTSNSSFKECSDIGVHKVEDLMKKNDSNVNLRDLVSNCRN